MDDLIRRYDAIEDGDLMLCPGPGVAYQRDMHLARVPYDEAYYQKCAGYEGSDIERALTAGRIAFVNKRIGPDRAALDIGIGSGAFIKARRHTYGIDINPRAVEWLREKNRYSDDFGAFQTFTMWDVIEHVEMPDLYFRAMPEGSWLFCCLPIFGAVTSVSAPIRESKHYRPGEHLYYFSERGFVNWMREYRWELVERAEFETAAGRDSIVSFAFRKSLPGYHETIAQYRKLYEPFYGASSRDLYLDLVAEIVKERRPESILDYGCGRSDLVAHFWADGARRIARFDPAIPGCEVMPDGEFDIVLCCDVMEHIRMEDVERVLREIRAKSRNVFFAISMKPARTSLPDGRNAHVTLLSVGEWKRWIKSVFGKAQSILSPWDHVLLLRTF